MGFRFYDAAHWQRVVDGLNRASDRGDVVGLDTEFYGDVWNGQSYDVRKMSPAGGRARVHLLSLAAVRRPQVLQPRGYHLADAAVVLSDALDFTPLVRWLESDAPKVAHNLSVDQHALANHGIALGGVMDTLEHSRWVWPERARGAGYSLDALGNDFLGVGKTDSFSDVFSEEVEECVRTKLVTTTTCSCAIPKCRKRKGHEKTKWTEEIPVMRTVRRSIPLESVVPGHPRWSAAVEYSARDAILAVNLHEVIQREMKKEVVWPW